MRRTRITAVAAIVVAMLGAAAPAASARPEKSADRGSTEAHAAVDAAKQALRDAKHGLAEERTALKEQHAEQKEQAKEQKEQAKEQAKELKRDAKQLKHDAKQLAKLLRKARIQINGVVTNVDAVTGTIGVRVRGTNLHRLKGSTTQVSLATGGAVFRNGRPATLADLKVGDHVAVKGMFTAATKSVTAATIRANGVGPKPAPPAVPAPAITGTITGTISG